MTDQPELDALIVRNIGDIGAANNRAKKEIDHRLWAEAGAIIANSAAAMGGLGYADAPEERAWLSHPDWLEAGDNAEDPPFYLYLNERVEPGIDAEWTWLASFVGAWPGRSTMGLFVGDDRLKLGAWKKQLRSSQTLVDSLVASGFRYDGPTGDLYSPILIDPELLANAFEEDAFEEAFQPLTEALSIAATAHTELTALYRLPAAG